MLIIVLVLKALELLITGRLFFHFSGSKLLFLDEPTSGLDSFSSFNLIKLLKEVAAANCAIICTIHQPSSEVFFLFDTVMYMREGRVFYHGPVTNVVTYFGSLGYLCPDNFNPSDYVMDLCQSSEPDVEKLFISAPILAEETSTLSIADDSAFRIEQSIALQVYMLFKREIINNIRDSPALIGRFGVTFVLCLVYGLIFLDAADTDSGDYEKFGSHVGAVSMMMIFCLFGSAQSVMLGFPYERPMFLREYSTGTCKVFCLLLHITGGLCVRLE